MCIIVCFSTIVIIFTLCVDLDTKEFIMLISVDKTQTLIYDRPKVISNGWYTFQLF